MKNLNNMLRVFFLVLCLFAISQTHAQKFAGYRGKHFMAGYTLNIGHNLFAYEWRNVSSDNIRLHFRHGLQAEFITNRFTTMGIEADYINTNIGKYLEQGSFGESTLYHARFVSMSAGGFMKLYFGAENGLIAPLGAYGKLKIFVEKMHVLRTAAGKTETANKYWSPGFGFAFGESRIIKNAVRLDGAVELNALLGVLTPAAVVFGNTELMDRHDMAFYHLLGYGSTVRIGVSGLLF
jgi:hypothetical protein